MPSFEILTQVTSRNWRDGAAFGSYGPPPAAVGASPYAPQWRLYAPESASKQFRTLSCVEISKDGMVYVCDRQNNRIQVFQKDGKFVKEGVISKGTTGDGAVWDVAFSNDAQQRYLFVADGHDKKIIVVDRDTLQPTGATIGSGGRYPGQFYGVGSIAVDSRGNLYTGETYEGKRVQKFVRK